MRLSNQAPKPRSPCSGWSLLELLLVLSLMAILVATNGPQLFQSWRLQQLHDERQRLLQAFHFARITSLQKKQKVYLCWHESCGSPAGFIIYLDVNADGTWQAEDISLQRWQLPKHINLTSNRGDQISFSAAGTSVHAGTFTLCSFGISQGKSLVLSSGGRVRQVDAPCV